MPLHHSCAKQNPTYIARDDLNVTEPPSRLALHEGGDPRGVTNDVRNWG